ncbi:MAG TPA: AgmX/PglI C-terminal domain-containing protein [Kofleriaceae bacterium]
MGLFHGTSRQRGSVVLYLLFSLATSVAVGYGVYSLIRARSEASADAAVVERPTPARPLPRPAVTPTPAPPHDPSIDDSVDVADRDAVPPEDIPDPPEDTVLLGLPGVAGGLEAVAVERTVRRYIVRFERCMRKARERNAVPRGDLRLTFVIAADGEVEYVSGKTSIDDELTTCVLDLVKKLRFDKSTDGAMVKVVYPIRFVPKAS